MKNKDKLLINDIQVILLQMLENGHLESKHENKKVKLLEGEAHFNEIDYKKMRLREIQHD